MRICFDLSPAVYHRAGIGRYTHELLAALVALDHTNTYSGFYNAVHGDELPDPPLDRLPLQKVRLSAKQWRMAALLSTMGGLSLDRWLPLPSCDTFHATDYVLPPLHGARSVFTVYDLTTISMRQYHLPLNRWFVRVTLPQFLRRSDAIIAISEQTRRDVVEMMHVPEEKITVVYLGVNPAFRPIEDATELARVRLKYHLPTDYLLYVGTIEPRKNLLTLLRAYRILLDRLGHAPSLVIAGRKGWLHSPVFRCVTELGLGARVHFTDWIEQADLPALFSGARAFVYPSLYEGFGLPPLEAMACGTPVICSNASSLPEVVGESGVLFEPRDTQALARAMEQVLMDKSLHADLRARGLVQAGKFSWERTARETLAVYDRVTREQHAHRH